MKTIGLSADETAETLCLFGKNADEIIDVMTGLGSAGASSISGISGLGNAFNGLGVQLKAAAKSAITFLTTNPAGWAIMAAGAIAIAATAYSAFNETFDESVKNAEDSIIKYRETEDELKNLQEEYDATKSRIEELKSVGSPELIDSGEIQKLETANELLNAQILARQKLADYELQVARDDANEVLTRKDRVATGKTIELADGTFVSETESLDIIERTQRIQKEISEANDSIKSLYAEQAKYEVNSVEYNEFENSIERVRSRVSLLDSELAENLSIISENYNTIAGVEGYEDTTSRVEALIFSISEYNEAISNAGDSTDELTENERRLQERTELFRASVDNLKTSLSDFADLQGSISDALSESTSATGVSQEQVAALTAAYGELSDFDSAKLFEDTANGIHLNTEELNKLNREYASNEVQKYADTIKSLREEIYYQRARGGDTSGLEAQLEDTRILKSQYEGLLSAYNKWLTATSGANERDSYAGIGKSFEDMKAILDQGWYGDESLNAYLDLLLSTSERTGDALKDFEKLQETISGTSHSLMDYWSYDEDNNLVTDGLFDFLDDVNKKLGDTYASISDSGEYAFDFTGEKLQDVADAFGVSTELIELFKRALIDAGMAVDMGDLTLVQEIERSLKELKDNDGLSDTLNLDFDVDYAPIQEVHDFIDDLKDEKIRIESEDPELAKQLDDLIAKCEEQYYFRLNAETDGALDDAINIVNAIKNIQDNSNLSIHADVQNDEVVYALAEELAALPTEIQTAIGVTTDNAGNAEAILSQLKNAPQSISVPVNYTTGSTPESVEDAAGIANYELGDYPKAVPDASGTVNFKLGTYPKTLPTITQNVHTNYTGGVAGRADGTAILNHYRATNAYAYSSNWALPWDESALVNELGTESIVRDGRWFTIPGGAHIEQLKKGDIVFSAKQTEELIRTGRVISGGGHGRVALADGTACNTLALNAYAGSSRRPTTTTATSTSSTKKSTKSSSSSKKSTSSSDTLESLDWIEIAIDRISRAVENLKTIATSAYKALKTKLGSTYDEISMVNQEISIQQKAYERYMSEASKVGLSSDLAKLVREGEIDIDKYGENTRELISEYQQWHEKALECDDAITQLHEDLAALYEDNFNAIKDDFDNQLELLEHLTNTYDTAISAVEAQGYLESTKYYAALQDVERQNIAVLQAELAALTKSMSEAMNSGEIESGSEAWYEFQTEINTVKEAIDEANLSMLEYAQTMREVEWGHFDYIQERISQITNESEFLIDLLSGSDLFDDNGNMNANGTATAGLHGMNYNTYMNQADQYAQEILSLDEQIANDPNNTQLIDRREELLKLQRESILAAEAEKQALVDLVQDGICLQLESMRELIDSYTEALDSAKSLYDYQKKVSEQTGNIANIQKQLSAYSGDYSQEGQAKVQQLQTQLKDAESALQETEYEKYISDQKALLDSLYIEYETALNSRMDNIDVLIEEMISYINENATLIADTLASESENVGYVMSDSMQEVWNGAFESLDGIISVYGDDFTLKLTSINSVLERIQANTAAMVGESDDSAQDTIGGTSTTTNPTPGVTAPVSTPAPTHPSNNSGSNKSITVGGKINAGNAKIYEFAGDTSGEKQFYSDDPVYTVLEEKNGYIKVRHHRLSSGVSGWFKKSDVKAYKTGGLVDYTGLAWVDGQKSKPESFLDAEDTAMLRNLTDTLSELEHRNLTIGNLAEYNAIPRIGGIDVSKLISSIGGAGNAGNTFGDINFDIHIDHVEDYDDFVGKMQSDPRFERLVQDMTVNRIVGGSSLNKYRNRFGK